MTTPHRDQFSGCLIGQCLGDALGFAVEGYSPAACKRYVEDYLKTGRAAEFGHFPFPFGQYSDDSQLARELIQSYIECKGFDPSDYARRITAIFSEKRIIGFGYSTKEAAKRLAQGISWEESGVPPPSAGNGSAMRAAPIGLFFYDNTESLIQSAHNQGRITHKDTRCSAGAIAISGAVSYVLKHKEINHETFIESLAQMTERIDNNFTTELKKLTKIMKMKINRAAESIKQAGITSDYVIDEYESKGISSFVIPSVLWSLYSFLKTPNDYFETICTAIEVGGDVDTTAAMAGAISGAYLGINAIPQELTKYLNDRGTWKYNELIELAHKCYDIKTQNLHKT